MSTYLSNDTPKNRITDTGMINLVTSLIIRLVHTQLEAHRLFEALTEHESNEFSPKWVDAN